MTFQKSTLRQRQDRKLDFIIVLQKGCCDAGHIRNITIIKYYGQLWFLSLQVFDSGLVYKQSSRHTKMKKIFFNTGTFSGYWTLVHTNHHSNNVSQPSFNVNFSLLSNIKLRLTKTMRHYSVLKSHGNKP